jgi:acylphosphatase
LPDGSVEALVQGEPAAVEAVVAWARRGPPLARVTAVDVDEAPHAPVRGFRRGPSE